MKKYTVTVRRAKPDAQGAARREAIARVVANAIARKKKKQGG